MVGALAAANLVSHAASLGTAFTYQGRLQDGPLSATGSYDIRFTIYDALSGGVPVGNSLTNAATLVTNGLFTVSLDFGTTVFAGNARWLDLAVRTNGGAAFVPLIPRQPLSPAPNAIYAAKAGTAASAATASAVAAGSVGTAGLAVGAVDSSRIADGAIGTTDLSPTVLSNTFWRLGGNAHTTPGANFLGTADNQPLEFKANGQRALRLEPGTGGLPNLVGGAGVNTVEVGVFGAVIGGGGAPAWPNRVAANNGIIAGGIGQQLNSGADNAVISGGAFNVIESSASDAAISGGRGNRIQSSAVYAAIGGGLNNTNGPSAIAATIPGGRDNYAGGLASFAAGRRAKALNSGVFVWADYTDADFASTGQNQFLIRATGGVGIGTNHPQAALHVVGNVIAGNFVGSGAALTSLNGAALTDGSITASKFAPGAVNHLDAPDGSPVSALQVNTNGLVGIGTATPQAGLDLQASGSHLTPTILSQVQDGTGNFTNLFWAGQVAAWNNLVAIGATGAGVTLLDVTQPTYPQILWQVRDETGAFTNLSQVKHVALTSNLLAITAASDNAVTLVSVTNPSNPVKVAELRGGVGSLLNCSGPEAVAMSGDLMAVVGYWNHSFALVNLANPANPVQLAVVTNGTGNFTNLLVPVSAALSGNLLAIAAQGSDAVTLVSVANPANPIKLAEIKNGTGSYTNLENPTCVALSGNLMAILSIWSDVTLVNVSNPAQPVWLANLPARGSGSGISRAPTALAFSGNRLAVATWSRNQVKLYDLTDPARPQLLGAAKAFVGGADYLNGPQGLAFVGTNLVVAAAESSAMTVLTFSPAPSGLFSQGWVGIGTRTPAAPLHVVGNVVIDDAQLFNANALRVALGYRTTATADGSVALGLFTASSGYAATALGNHTTASAASATALGLYTTASAGAATAMGWSTAATNSSATSLGSNTLAGGAASLAAGTRAKAVHNGAFVWADQTAADFNSTGPNQFLVRASGGVGIGTNNPGGAALNVAGNVRATAFQGDGAGLTGMSGSSISTGTIGDARLSANVALRNGGNTLNGAQVISSGSLRMSDQEIFLRSGTDANHGLGWYGVTKPFAGGNVDGPVLYGWTGGGLGSMSGGQRLALQWDTTGSVAVDCGALNAGSLAPGLKFGGLGSGEGIASKRTAGGNQFGLDFFTSFANRMSILSGGNIGIGTTNPVRRLHIMDGSGPTQAGGSIQVGMASTGGDPKLIYFGDGDWVHIGENGADDTMELKATRFFFTGGNLGIDTNNPAYKIHLAGGAYCNGTQWVNASDRDRKEGFQTVDGEEVLKQLAALPLSTWSYKDDPSSRHLGPTAQDFHARFGLGKDDKAIGTVDADGVALAALQGLNQKLEATRAELRGKQAEIDDLKQRLTRLEKLMPQSNKP